MNLRRLALFLFATGLLLSTLGCSKKDDPATSNIGSYLYDGQLINCTATADIYSDAGADFLTLNLKTTPPATTRPETLRLIFRKDASEPASAYVLLQMQQFADGSIIGLSNPDTFTLVPTSTGGFSGTFSSVSQYTNPGLTPHSFTSGVFTDVHP
jgi:hypothetical protein